MDEQEYKPLVVDILDETGKRVRCRNCRLQLARYRDNGNLAIQAFCTGQTPDAEDGEPWGVLTVNPLEQLDDEHVAIKDYSEGAGNLMTLQRAGLVGEPERWIPSGFVQIPVCPLTEKGREWVKAYALRQAQATAFKVGDRVRWTDPDGGETTPGWTVTSVPEPDDDGEAPEDGIYTILSDTGSEAEVYAGELNKESEVDHE